MKILKSALCGEEKSAEVLEDEKLEAQKKRKREDTSDQKSKRKRDEDKTQEETKNNKKTKAKGSRRGRDRGRGMEKTTGEGVRKDAVKRKRSDDEGSEEIQEIEKIEQKDSRGERTPERKKLKVSPHERLCLEAKLNSLWKPPLTNGPFPGKDIKYHGYDLLPLLLDSHLF